MSVEILAIELEKRMHRESSKMVVTEVFIYEIIYLNVNKVGDTLLDKLKTHMKGHLLQNIILRLIL